MSLPSKNWVVIGAGGFIGQNLCEFLLKKGQSVVAFDRSLSLNPNITTCHWTTGDFLNFDVLNNVIAGADYVVHLITTVTPASSNADPVRDVQENLVGTLHLMEICKKNKIKKLITLSSGGTVYGPTAPVPAAEDSPCEPICSYGIVKLAIEKYASLYRHHGQLDSVVLRVSNPYGPYQIARDQGFIAAALERAIKNEAIEVWGDGSVIRDYIYIKDVVTAIFACAEQIRTNAPHLYNIGSGHGRSINSVLDIIEEIHGELKIVTKPSRLLDVPVSILDIKKAESFLGWKPATDWRQGILETYNWMKAHIHHKSVKSSPSIYS